MKDNYVAPLLGYNQVFFHPEVLDFLPIYFPHILSISVNPHLFSCERLKSLWRQGLSEPDFYGDLVYKLKKILALIIFQRSSLKQFPIIKRLAITLMYCNRLHAWWSTQSWLATLLSSLIARRWVGFQTLC